MVVQFNATSAWAVRWILGERELDARARVVQFIIQVCTANSLSFCCLCVIVLHYLLSCYGILPLSAVFALCPPNACVLHSLGSLSPFLSVSLSSLVLAGEMVAQFNATSAWAVSWIIGERELDVKARVVQFIIQVCPVTDA